MTSPLREMAAAAGDGARRLRAAGHRHLARRGRRAGARVQRDGRRAGGGRPQRRELVANVSHELRTPITALQALLENVADGVEPADPATLGRPWPRPSGSGGSSPSCSTCRGWRAARWRCACAVALRPFLDRRRARRVGEAYAAPCAARAASRRATCARRRPRALHQVVANLLDNAVRHSPAGGPCRRGAAAATGSCEVADEGPGIPPREAERVFERFSRADAPGPPDGAAVSGWPSPAGSSTPRRDDRRPRAGAARLPRRRGAPEMNDPSRQDRDPCRERHTPRRPGRRATTTPVWAARERAWRSACSRPRPLVGQPLGLGVAVVLLALGAIAARCRRPGGDPGRRPARRRAARAAIAGRARVVGAGRRRSTLRARSCAPRRWVVVPSLFTATALASLAVSGGARWGQLVAGLGVALGPDAGRAR